MDSSDVPEKPRVQKSIFAGLHRRQFIGGACGQSCDQQPGPQVRSSAWSGWGVRLSLFRCMAGGCRGAERGETLACEVTRFAGGGAAGREQAPGPGLIPVRVPTAHPWLASSARSRVVFIQCRFARTSCLAPPHPRCTLSFSPAFGPLTEMSICQLTGTVHHRRAFMCLYVSLKVSEVHGWPLNSMGLGTLTSVQSKICV